MQLQNEISRRVDLIAAGSILIAIGDEHGRHATPSDSIDARSQSGPGKRTMRIQYDQPAWRKSA